MFVILRCAQPRTLEFQPGTGKYLIRSESCSSERIDEVPLLIRTVDYQINLKTIVVFCIRIFPLPFHVVAVPVSEFHHYASLGEVRVGLAVLIEYIWGKFVDDPFEASEIETGDAYIDIAIPGNDAFMSNRAKEGARRHPITDVVLAANVIEDFQHPDHHQLTLPKSGLSSTSVVREPIGYRFEVVHSGNYFSIETKGIPVHSVLSRKLTKRHTCDTVAYNTPAQDCNLLVGNDPGSCRRGRFERSIIDGSSEIRQKNRVHIFCT